MDTAAYFNLMAQADVQGRAAGRRRRADAGEDGQDRPRARASPST